MSDTLVKSEKYMGILQPLEAFVSIYFRTNPMMHDYDVLSVYEALLKFIKAKITNYPVPEIKLKDLSLELYEALFYFIMSKEENYSWQEIQESLKMLEKSVKRWNSRNGSQGYLKFISQFN